MSTLQVMQSKIATFRNRMEICSHVNNAIQQIDGIIMNQNCRQRIGPNKLRAVYKERIRGCFVGMITALTTDI